MTTRFIVLALAILQPIAGYVSTLPEASILMDSSIGPRITPAGYAFSIWAVITAGSCLYAIYQILPQRRNATLYERIAPYAAITFLGFTAWLYAAQQEWLLATIGIFLVMGAALYRILREVVVASRAHKLSSLEQIIVHGTFGLYAGWATVAIVANIAAVIAARGLASTAAVGWQLGILALAALVSAFGIRQMRASLPYVAAILWAFVAIVVGTIEEGGGVLTYAAVVGLVAAAVTAWTYSRK